MPLRSSDEVKALALDWPAGSAPTLRGQHPCRRRQPVQDDFAGRLRPRRSSTRMSGAWARGVGVGAGKLTGTKTVACLLPAVASRRGYLSGKGLSRWSWDTLTAVLRSLQQLMLSITSSSMEASKRMLTTAVQAQRPCERCVANDDAGSTVGVRALAPTLQDSGRH